MKHRLRMTLFALLLGGMAIAQRGVRIAYVDMEYILENVEEYREASQQLETRVVQWKGQMEDRQRRIDELKQDLEKLTKDLYDKVQETLDDEQLEKLEKYNEEQQEDIKKALFTV